MKDWPDYLILAAVLTWVLLAAVTALLDNRKLVVRRPASRRQPAQRR
jgi:hypothetical protein